MTFLQFDFMRSALLAAALVGLAAPAIGVFLVQRRLSLMGDGIGHVALTGVSIGLMTSTSPVATALVAAVLGAVAIEWLRARGRGAGDVALAVIFYGGIAGGVFLTSISPAPNIALFSYLFGSVLTVGRGDLAVLVPLSLAVLVIVGLLGKRFFAVAYDEEVARVSGLNVTALNMTLAIATAVTVVMSMRVVGLLLVAALMVIPVAALQSISRSFVQTVAGSLALGFLASVGGVIAAYYIDAAPGATVVLLCLAAFLFLSVSARLRRLQDGR